jgi:hypothetical protein
MSDEFALHNSMMSQEEDNIAQSLQYTYITDSNSSSYNQQVIFDLAGISNSGKYLDALQSFIVVPLVMTLTSTEGNINNASLENAFSASLKNGFGNLIHSMQIECTNNSVVSTMSYSNMAINYKLLTEMSTNDTATMASTINFAKDDPLSIPYKGSPSSQGLGECNNTINQQLFNPTAGFGKSAYSQNKGRLERMVSTSYDPASTGESLGSLNQSGKNYVQKDGLGAGGKTVNYYVLANIPLKMLSDFFAKLPLVKGAYFRLTLNLNVGCTTQMTVANGQFTSVSTSSQNGAVPYQISPLGAGFGLDIAGTVPSTGLELSIAIARNTINKSGITFTHPSITSCRFYGAMYDLTPQAESMYLSKSPTKKMLYEDFLSFQTLGVGAGSNFNQVLSNSVSRITKIVGIPVISSTANFAGSAGTISTLASPFSSSPCTTAKNPILNFNILLSGNNVFQSNLNYTFEQFYQELHKTGINGGSSTGMSSGLISQTDFEHGYRFLLADLSRTSSDATFNIAKSVQCTGTNSGDKAIDIYWFIFFEREVTIDIATGSLIA